MSKLGNPSHSHGWIKLYRGELTNELLRNPNAFLLLTQIALRARRTDAFNLANLKLGQCFVGDHQNLGLTRSKYRTALKFLEKNGFVKVVGKSRLGTVVRLETKDFFDINERASRKSPATSSPVSSQHIATNKNTNNGKKEGTHKTKTMTQAPSFYWRANLLPNLTTLPLLFMVVRYVT